MDEIKKLWEEVCGALHYGPNTLPLWRQVISKLDEFEARIKAIEFGLEPKVMPSMSIMTTDIEVVPESSETGNKSVSPSDQPAPAIAGLDAYKGSYPR